MLTKKANRNLPRCCCCCCEARNCCWVNTAIGCCLCSNWKYKQWNTENHNNYISLCEGCSVNTPLLSNSKYTMYKSMQYLQTENAHKTSFRCATGFNKIERCVCVWQCLLRVVFSFNLDMLFGSLIFRKALRFEHSQTIPGCNPCWNLDCPWKMVFPFGCCSRSVPDQFLQDQREGDQAGSSGEEN